MASKLPSQTQPQSQSGTANPKPPPRFNPTAAAIGGSMLLAVVLTSIFFANPITAVRRAYQGLESPKPIASEPAITAPGDQPR